MKRTYVGSTIYHIYLFLLHILKESGYSLEHKGENLLFLIESTPHIEKIIPNLKKSFFRDVHIISARRKHVNDLGKLNYSLLRKKKLIPYLEKKHPQLADEKQFIAASQLYLGNTDSSASYFMYAYGRKHLQMIEDGAKSYVQRHSVTEKLIKNITNTPIGGGYDKKIKTIHAQFPEQLPHKLRRKAKELNIKTEVAKLNLKLKEEIFAVFLSDVPFEMDGAQNALILTQPISEDRVVDSEETKINIYKDVIAKIPSHLNIILKTHPRELTNYNEHFTNITVLPGLFPIEILGLKEDFYFEKGYTLFSTALSNMGIVKERYFLGKDYLDKFTAKSIKAIIMNMPDNDKA